jgi:hypothetical protein
LNPYSPLVLFGDVTSPSKATPNASRTTLTYCSSLMSETRADANDAPGLHASGMPGSGLPVPPVLPDPPAPTVLPVAPVLPEPEGPLGPPKLPRP